MQLYKRSSRECQCTGTTHLREHQSSKRAGTGVFHCSPALRRPGNSRPFHPVDDLLTDCARIVPRASISHVTTAPSHCRAAKAQASPVTSTTSVNMSWTVAETPPTQELPYMSPYPTCVTNSYSLLFTEMPALRTTHLPECLLSRRDAASQLNGYAVKKERIL